MSEQREESLGLAMVGDFPFACRFRRAQWEGSDPGINLLILKGLEALEQVVLDDEPLAQRLARVEAKTDLLLAHAMVATSPSPVMYPTLLRMYPNGVYFYGNGHFNVGDPVEVWVQMSPLTPPLYFVGWVDIVDPDAFFICFAGLDEAVENGLGKAIFRRHRRWVRDRTPATDSPAADPAAGTAE